MTSRSIRAALAAAAAVAVAAAMAGCSSGSGGKQTLEFQTAQSVDSPIYAALKSVTADFEKAHPDIDIDLKTGGNDYESQMKVRLAARRAPDLWATHGWSLLRYSSFLAPLDKEPWAKNFDNLLSPVMKDKQGRFYALPITSSAAGLIVNRDVLAKAGVDESSLSTWDGLQAAEAKVKAAGVTPFYLAGSKDGSAGNVIDWLAPGAFSEADLKRFSSGTFPTSEYERLLDVLAKMRTQGDTNVDYTSASGDDMARALAEGRGAFALSGNALITSAWQYNPDADLSYLPVPSIDGGKPYLIGGEDTAFGASRTGKHLAAAKTYLAFLAKPANLERVAKAVGNPPGLTDATAELGKLQSPYEEYVKSGDVPLRPFFDRVSLPNGMWDTVVTTADGVIADQTSPAQGAKKMAADYATLSKQAK